MISTRIPCKPQNDNYRRLAGYIAAGRGQEVEHGRSYGLSSESYLTAVRQIAGNRLRQLSQCHLASYSGKPRKFAHLLSFDARTDRRAAEGVRRDDDRAAPVKGKPEKCLFCWSAGCWAGDDYELAIQEVLDTQALNTRTGKEKTYHLVVSFRPEDESRLTEETLKEMERRFAEALGLSEHQRHCGVHVNTDNLHMHVAYNLIHPEKLTRREPWRDYIKRDRLCRELEKEYGLSFDNGRDSVVEKGLGEQAARMEAHTGKQSLEGYAREHGEAILDVLEQARSWDDAHHAFAVYGLELKPRGAGLVVANRHGGQHVKASAVHRELSLKKLEARFGVFRTADIPLPESKLRYEPQRPIQQTPDLTPLWEEYQTTQERSKRKTDAGIEDVRRQWAQYRASLERQPIAKRSRINILKLARQREAQAVHAVRMKHAVGSWLEFLKDKAEHGNETALAVLRSRRMEVQPESAAWMRERADYLATQVDIQGKAVSGRTKAHLSCVALMESLYPGTKSSVSSHGEVIFTLPDGGKICDSGRRIRFSPEARSVAMTYMAAKWHVRGRERDESGKPVYTLSDGRKIRDGGLMFERPPAGERHKERSQDFER